MYLELRTDQRSFIDQILAQQAESTEPVQITLKRRDGLYCLEAVCKREPDADVT